MVRRSPAVSARGLARSFAQARDALLLPVLLLATALPACRMGGGLQDEEFAEREAEEERQEVAAAEKKAEDAKPKAKALSLSIAANPVAGSCAGPGKVEIQDQFGKAIKASAATTVSLSLSGGGKLYSSSVCSQALDSVSIQAASESADFYLKSTTSGSATLTASSSSLASATASISVVAGALSAIALDQVTSSPKLGDCVELKIAARDASGNNVILESAKTATVTSTESGGVFYSDSACASAKSSFEIGAGVATVSVWYKGATAGTYALTPAVSGLTSTALSLVLSARSTASISLSGNSAPTAGACSTYTLSLLDSLGNITPSSGTTSLALGGAGSGAYYSDENCLTSSGTKAIGSGSSAGTVYFKSSVAESVTLSVSASGLTTGTKAVSLQASTVSQIQVSPPSSPVAGTCNSFTATYRDAYGNLTAITAPRILSMAGSGSIGYYSGSTCATSISSLTSALSATTETFYVKDTVSETVSVTLSSTGLTSASASITVIGSSLASLSFAGTTGLMPSECGTFTIRARDAYGNAPYGDLTLSYSGLGSGSFYSGAGCTSAISSSALASSVGSVTVYFKDTATETLAAAANASGVTGTQAVTMAPGTGVSLSIVGPTKVYSSYCSDTAYTVSIRDSYGNATNATAATSLTFTGLGDFWEPYNANHCIGRPLAALSISNGSPSTTFYLTGMRSRSDSITLDDGAAGLTAGTVSVSSRTKVDVQFGATGSTCGVLPSGRFRCWGAGATGMVDTNYGDAAGETGDNIPLANLGTNRTVVRFSGYWPNNGGYCALLDDRKVKCWGYPDSGSLGNESTTVTLGNNAASRGDNLPYVNIGSNRTIFSVAGGYNTNCVVVDTGQVKCWGLGGASSMGAHGHGDTVARGGSAGQMGDSLPFSLTGSGFVKDIRCSWSHCCAVYSDGRLKCWGGNTAYGYLGYGDTLQRDVTAELGDSLPYVNLGTNRTVKLLAPSTLSNCAILDDNRTVCWGAGLNGRLLIGGTSSIGESANEMGDSLVPAMLGTNRYAVEILGDHSNTAEGYCALLDNGIVKCWGKGTTWGRGYGELADRGDSSDETGDNLPAVDIGTNRRGIRLVSQGYGSFGVIADDYSFRGWGAGHSGKLMNRSSLAAGAGTVAGTMGDNLISGSLGSEDLSQ